MEENKKTKGNLTIVILLVIIIVLATIGVIYYMNNSAKDNNGNSVENVGGEDNNQISNENKTEDLKMTAEEFPKVDGATAMLPMIGEITKAVLGYNDEQAQKFLDENTQGKTAKVYQGLIDGKTNVIFASEPSDDILQTAKKAGVEFEMTGIGLDGFVFLINEQNPVKSLTLDQIRGIYTGKITNWKEVGGDDAKIIAYQREKNSGSQNLMEKMVMQGEKMTDTANTNLEIGSMSGLIDGVSSQENSKYAIGYSIYLYAKEQYVKGNVKFLAIDGVEATDENITNKSYPLTKIVYAITKKSEPQDSSARKLINWLLTDKGQKVVEAGGYVRNTK